MIKIGLVGKNYIAKQLVGTQVLKIARPKTLCQFTVIRAAHKGTSANDGQLTLAVNLDRQCKALEPGMATVMGDGVGAGRALVGSSTERVAQPGVFRRRLQCFAN